MAHNLETNGNEVAFALRGTPAWHNLANRIFSQDEDVSTAINHSLIYVFNFLRNVRK